MTHRPGWSVTGALVLALMGSAGALALLVWWTQPFPRQPDRGHPDSDRTTVVPAAGAAQQSTAGARTLAAPRATGGQPRRAWTFEQYMERLVVLGNEMRSAAAADEQTARDLDAQCQQLVEAMEEQFHRIEEPALDALMALPPTSADPTVDLRRRILQKLLDRALARHEQGVERAGRGPLDSLVALLLASLPKDPATAAVCVQLVVLGERLALAHEDAVLDIASQVEASPWLAGAATALLEALWRNLGATGARSGGELAALALLFKDDANPSRRLAAYRALLTLQGGRYREVVVQEILSRGDSGAATAVVGLAAEVLPVDVALDILQRLAGVARRDLAAPCMVLAQRDLDAVRDSYERLLANGVEPRLRADLVTGLGLQRDSSGSAAARLAFDQDPNPEVRDHALLALTGMAAGSHGLEAFAAAVADPRYDAPRGLGSLVLALENLALDASDRVRPRVVEWAEQLKRRRGLTPGDLRRLDQIAARVALR